MTCDRLQFRMFRGELLEDGLVEVVEGVNADSDDDEQGDGEDDAQQAGVDESRALSSGGVGAAAVGGLLALLHQPPHALQPLTQLVHRFPRI